MARIISNTRPGADGVGFVKMPFAHLTITGKAGEEVRVTAADLYPKGSQQFQGIYVQALGGTVNFQTTLAPAQLALDAAQDGSGYWNTAQAIATSVITKITNPTTVLRIHFVAAATVYVIAV